MYPLKVLGNLMLRDVNVCFHYVWLRGKRTCIIHLVKPFSLENLNIHFVSSFSTLFLI